MHTGYARVLVLMRTYLAALITLGLSACQADIKDGVYTCSVSADCPSGLHCHPTAKRCTRQLFDSADSDASLSVERGTKQGANSTTTGTGPAAGSNESMDMSMPAPGGSMPAPVQDASLAPDIAADGGGASMHDAASDGHGPSTAADSGSRAPGTSAAAGSGGEGGTSDTAPGSSGGTHAEAGSGGEGASPAAGSGAPEPEPCPRGTYCYGFEQGALDPSGALWPSPSDGRGGLPPHDELTTAPYPASSNNPMLVSRPSSQDGWPKATVGFSGPEAPFSKLEVSFDYAAGDELVTPNPRVILFRFVGTPARNGDSVNIGLLNSNVMLEVQTSGADPLSIIGRAAPPHVLTHVAASFTRSPGACTVSITYGELPLTAADFPCDVERWQIELGLDLLETPPDQYDDRYIAYFDNLRVSATP